MMRYVSVALLTLLSRLSFGQAEDRFRNFHGIKNPYNNVDYFEAEGYDIFIQDVDNGLDEKGISKIKKRYGAKDAQLTTDSVLNTRMLARTELKNGVTLFCTYYLFPKTEKKSRVIGFVRTIARDVSLEREFVNSFLSDKIPSFVYTELGIDSINFAGRTIQLGPICQWKSPHNIQCPDRGQMNWAIFEDLKQAETYRDVHYELTKSKNLLDVKEEKWITLKFEGHETKALRTKVKVQLPKLVMGGNNLLIVYYVTGPVRGKYVTCILSYYTDDAAPGQLPPLLGEVLELID